MPSLHEFQLQFTHSLFDIETPEFKQNIIADRLPAEKSLDIYRNNVFGSQTDALRGVYPVIERLVGEKFFETTAHHYIRQYPSHSGDLHDYGQEFAIMLDELPTVQSLPFLKDMARLEWVCHRAFYAADHPPLNIEQLQTIPQEKYPRLKFELNPAIQFIESEYPVHLIWEVNQPDFEGEPRVNLDEGGIRLMAQRKNYRVSLQPLDLADWEFLLALKSHQNFDQACEVALQSNPDFNIQEKFQHYVSETAIVGFSFD
jgi:hypothetical protein